MYYYSFYESPIGKLIITEDDGQLTGLYFNKANFSLDEDLQAETGLIMNTKKQLDEYFSGRRNFFTLPLKPKGSEFMQKVWQALCEIPYGATTSYKDISRVIGHPRAYRAVGMANNKNPLPIIIPCHRVIASDGKLCGYGGGVAIKQYLLDLEKNNLNKAGNDDGVF